MKRSSIMFAAIAAASAAFATPMLIPAPREMTMTGGLALVADNAPKVEVVVSIPPEGYELLIATNGVTIRHSDAARLRGVLGARGGTPPPPRPRPRKLRPAEIVLQYSGC